VSTWGSPAIDLIYALYTMANKETRLNHRDELITYYYTHFVETLTKIGYMSPAPTLHCLQMELLRCGVLELFVSACFLPFFQFDLSHPPPEVDLEKMFDPSYGMDFRTMVCELPEYTDDMQKLLPHFMHMGFMD
jgi:Ecdysteroid kinase-like family